VFQISMKAAPYKRVKISSCGTWSCRHRSYTNQTQAPRNAFASLGPCKTSPPPPDYPGYVVATTSECAASQGRGHDWRSTLTFSFNGDSANGSGAGTRYNWVWSAREIEDNDNRSWPGSSTAEQVPPGGATTAPHFDIGPTACVERTALRSSNLRSRK
jgi:hypothetical protein